MSNIVEERERVMLLLHEHSNLLDNDAKLFILSLCSDYDGNGGYLTEKQWYYAFKYSKLINTLLKGDLKNKRNDRVSKDKAAGRMLHLWYQS